MKPVILAIASSLLFVTSSLSAPDYTIEAIRYGTIPQFPVSGLVVGAAANEKIDIPLVFWLVRGEGRSILLDAGFYRQNWMDRFKVKDFIRPDEAVRQAGVDPTGITDAIISHAHWDHVGGVELFPNATIWIQKDEFAYYTGLAWQAGGDHGGIDPEDMLVLLRRNTQGKLRLVDGDDREILPGIRVFTGARHTFSSQYIRIDGNPPFVLASDNCYLYRNLETRTPIPTFTPGDREGNLKALDRMVSLAGASERVVPSHDPLLFVRFPTKGRIARIK